MPGTLEITHLSCSASTDGPVILLSAQARPNPARARTLEGVFGLPPVAPGQSLDCHLLEMLSEAIQARIRLERSERGSSGGSLGSKFAATRRGVRRWGAWARRSLFGLRGGSATSSGFATTADVTAAVAAMVER